MRDGRRVITVFGSAFAGDGTSAYRVAYEVGLGLGKAGFIVCNGGYGGSMEASGKGAFDAGAGTVGIISKSFRERTANRWMKEVIEVPTHMDRLVRLIHEGDGYVVLPGGTGTLLELAAVWEMMNKQILSHRPVVLVGAFWRDLVALMDSQLLAEGQSPPSRFLLEADSPAACTESLVNYFKGES